MPKHQANLDFVVTDDHVSQPVRQGRAGGRLRRDRAAGRAAPAGRDGRVELLQLPRDADEVRHLLPRQGGDRPAGPGPAACCDRRPAPRGAAEGAEPRASARSSRSSFPRRTACSTTTSRAGSCRSARPRPSGRRGSRAWSTSASARTGCRRRSGPDGRLGDRRRAGAVPLRVDLPRHRLVARAVHAPGPARDDRRHLLRPDHGADRPGDALLHRDDDRDDRAPRSR